MTADFINTLFLGALTYLGHSTVFLSVALVVTSFTVLKNIVLKEMILRIALFAGLITAPLQMTGAFDPVVQPIAISEQTALAETPVFEPRITAKYQEMPVAKNDASMTVKPTVTEPTAWSTAILTLFVWALFGFAFLVQLGYLAFSLKVQLTGRRPVTDGRALQLVENLATALDIEAPRLSFKRNLASPFCLVSGEVIIPHWTLTLPSHQLKALLAHEMAHLKRLDPAWLITGRLVQGVLFFQPLNFVAIRKLGELSEFSCDAWSKKICGSGLALAECLAECVRRQLDQGPAVLGMAMATRRSPIIERTHVLLENVRDDTRPASRLAQLAVVAMFIATGLVIPAFALDEKIQIMKEANSPDAIFSSSNVMIEDNGRMIIDTKYQTNDRTIKIDGKGRYTLNGQESALISISQNGYLDIAEDTRKETRRVRYEEDGGNISETFWLDGDKVDNDADMRAWLARIIPDFYRQTGFDAESRTKFIYERDGANGVLDEMAQITDSYTLRTYGIILANIAHLNDKEALRFMDIAKIVSDSYDLSELLVTFVEKQTLSDAAWKALAGVAGNISDSYDLREVLTTAGKNFSGPPENWRTLVETAGHISSSYDLRETLTAFVSVMSKDDKTIAQIAEVSGKITSNYDLGETLSAYAKEGGYDTGGWLALLGAVNNVTSSYDRRSTLEVFAGHMPRNDQLVARYGEIASGISSDYDREEANGAL